MLAVLIAPSSPFSGLTKLISTWRDLRGIIYTLSRLMKFRQFVSLWFGGLFAWFCFVFLLHFHANQALPCKWLVLSPWFFSLCRPCRASGFGVWPQAEYRNVHASSGVAVIWAAQWDLGTHSQNLFLSLGQLMSKYIPHLCCSTFQFKNLRQIKKTTPNKIQTHSSCLTPWDITEFSHALVNC